MTRSAILHLGMNKAGSTTIQVALRAYDAPGIWWLQAPPFSQTQLVCLPFRANPPAMLFTRPDRKAEATDARAALETALGANDKSVILSSEFMSDFRDEADIARLVAALRAHVDEVRAVIYLRAPGAYLASVYQETLKMLLPQPGLGKLWPAYGARIRPWDRVLGRENVVVRPFDPKAFPGGDLMLDFAQHAGLDPATLPHHVKRANESLSLEAVALLHAYRLENPKPSPSQPGRKAVAHTVFTLKSFGTGRFAFSQKMTAKLLERRARDVAWAEARQGQPFAPPPDGALNALAHLPAQAEAALPAFRTWLAETHPQIARAVPDNAPPAQTIEAIVAHFAATV